MFQYCIRYSRTPL